MTSSIDTFPAQRSAQERDARAALRDAMADERRAYEAMRSLVPDLALPMPQRRPLSAEQQAAVDAYHHERERLEQLRLAQRSPGLALHRDQSL
jgi:hypothetical protein